jgi:hypothetical protein
MEGYSFKHVLYLTNLKKSPRYKWEALSKIMLLPEDWQELALPDSLFPLYGLLRPFLWLWRYHLRPLGNSRRVQDMD